MTAPFPSLKGVRSGEEREDDLSWDAGWNDPCDPWLSLLSPCLAGLLWEGFVEQCSLTTLRARHLGSSPGDSDVVTLEWCLGVGMFKK